MLLPQLLEPIVDLLQSGDIMNCFSGTAPTNHPPTAAHLIEVLALSFVRDGPNVLEVLLCAKETDPSYPG
jgi:hypothetical protein